ncbi:MAG: hypothetical protein ACYTG7_24305 [Planctomycetota bacterium]
MKAVQKSARPGSGSISDAALEELEELYARLDESISQPVFSCRGDGACCRFETSGLRLFATGLEVAFLIHKLGKPTKAFEPGCCPYQEGDACMARAGRPLGCRVYFCDPAAETDLHPLYEQYHREIIDLHARHDLKYAYGELLKLLYHS